MYEIEHFASIILTYIYKTKGLSQWLNGKESACQCRRHKFDPWVRKIPWRRKWQPTPVFLPGKSHRQRSLVGYTVHGVTRFRHNLVTKQLHKTKIFNASKIVYYLYMLVIGVNIVYFSWVILKLRWDIWHFFQLSFKPWNDLMMKLNNIHGEQTILFDLKHTEEWFVKELELWEYCEAHGNFLRRCCGLSIEQQENWSNSYPDFISLSLGRWHLIGTIADNTLISTE